MNLYFFFFLTVFDHLGLYSYIIVITVFGEGEEWSRVVDGEWDQ